MDGRLVYPSDLDRLAARAAAWRAATNGSAAFITAFHLDLAEDPDETFAPYRFGARTGRNRFLDHLGQLSAIGVDHLAVQLRRSRRPVEEVLDELAGDILPQLGRLQPSMLAA